MLKNLRNRKGQTAVEYAVILAAILIVSIGSISLLGNKTGELWALAAVTLPGQDPGDNGPIWTGELVETFDYNGTEVITVDYDAIENNNLTDRIDLNMFGGQFSSGPGDSLPMLLVGR